MNYQHTLVTAGQDYNVGKIVCVGRNYAEHARELGHDVPKEPLLFLKPYTSTRALFNNVMLYKRFGATHYECELALLVTETMTCIPKEAVKKDMFWYGLGLDLTLRDLQSKLKGNGHPWEISKAFDGSCILTPFIPSDALPEFDEMTFTFSINGEQKQKGDVANMLMDIPSLVSYISHYFTLLPGDVILTGTPEGVGVLSDGDSLQLQLQNYLFKGVVKGDML